jgi:hypothetical protein
MLDAVPSSGALQKGRGTLIVRPIGQPAEYSDRAGYSMCSTTYTQIATAPGLSKYLPVLQHA